jgi:hypothetical protein
MKKMKRPRITHRKERTARVEPGLNGKTIPAEDDKPDILSALEAEILEGAPTQG